MEADPSERPGFEHIRHLPQIARRVEVGNVVNIGRDKLLALYGGEAVSLGLEYATDHLGKCGVGPAFWKIPVDRMNDLPSTCHHRRG